ncbi:class I SAM-dependent methyltransferase [Roseomonas sp. CAU 1739]|uniref:class I SAM-dependent methyltransferase n=1 Tax=Roseomonas sp. CAU 1739 TaxID=3140364 RepID=UPI00325B90CE
MKVAATMLGVPVRRLAGKIVAALRPEAPRESRFVALPAIRPAALPAGYAERQANALSIDGMMSDFSMQVMDAVLTHQAARGLTGHVLEFGVWKGRSASILSAHIRDGERFILCDVGQYLTEQVLAKFYARPEFVQAGSSEFTTYVDVAPLRGSVRFAHVDSSHAYRDTLAEMALVDEILAPDGVACFDDFTNLNYAQILPAMFKYLFTTGTDLTFFLVTNDKGYLCRRPSFEAYATFVLRQLIDEMRMRGNADAMIARTDMDPEYRAFYLRPRGEGETGDHYGPSLYAANYEVP